MIKMNKTRQSVELDNWIYVNTMGSKCVVELGAGFFYRLACVPQQVPLKIGIEIYEPYVINAKYNDCVKIHGDALKYKELLLNYDHDSTDLFDTVMIIDVLEHFDKDVGVKLIEDLKNDFNKILLMMPVGKFVQDVDVTGHGGHEYQKHRSYWYEEDIEKLGFTENIYDDRFHITKERVENNEDIGCFFGVWKNNTI